MTSVCVYVHVCMCMCVSTRVYVHVCVHAEVKGQLCAVGSLLLLRRFQRSNSHRQAWQQVLFPAEPARSLPAEMSSLERTFSKENHPWSWSQQAWVEILTLLLWSGETAQTRHPTSSPFPIRRGVTYPRTWDSTQHRGSSH